MLNDHDVAVTALATSEIDVTITGGAYRRTDRCSKVDTLVLFPHTGDRVHSHRKAGTHSGELQRRFQESFFQGTAVKAVITALTCALIEPDGLKSFASVGELTCQHTAGTHQLTVLPEAFIHHIEFIATLQAAEGLRIIPLVRDDRVLVSFELTDGFTEQVKDAIHSGLKTTFTYTVELRLDVPVWADRTIGSAVVANSVAYDIKTGRQQKAAYPDIAPIELAVPPPQAFDRALAAAQHLEHGLRAARHPLELGVRILGPRDRNQLHLPELVLSQHAAGVAPGGTGLGSSGSFTTALLKGRANYVCHYHLRRNLAQGMLATREEIGHLHAIARFANLSLSFDPAFREAPLTVDLPALAKFRVVVDCCNGTSALILRRMIERYGLDLILINERVEGVQFAHEPSTSARMVELQLGPLMKPLQRRPPMKQLQRRLPMKPQIGRAHV